MEEARRLLARLKRVEALERGDAPPEVLLAELHALLADAEAWARTDHGASASVLETVRRCRRMLEEAGRTLLA